MRVEIKRSGGFAGLTETLVPATEANNAVREHLARLESLLAKAKATAGADFQRYEIATSEDGGPRRALTVVDDGHEDTPIMVELRAILGLLS